MTTPVDEIDMPRYPVPRRSSEDDGTVIGETPYRPATNDDRARLTVQTDVNGEGAFRNMQSPSQTREQAHRLEDDLTFLRIERQISQQNENDGDLSRNKSARSRRPDPVDDFDQVTNPLHEKPVYRPPENPNTSFSKFFKKIHESSFIIRYFTYIAPLALIILIPLLLGFFVFEANVGGVSLRWFCIWLEIVWLTLWAGRILAKCLPYPIGLISSIFTNNSKKWRDMGKQLELPATLFFWWLAIEISFLPTMTNHHVNGDKSVKNWEKNMNKVLVAIFVGVILNFVEKIIIQLIAISFHLRTYQDRIELNKFQIDSLTKLYTFSKEKITADDSEFENPSKPASGARTPAKFIKGAQKQGREALSKFGDVAGKIAGDFTGREISTSTHPSQVILYLLSTTPGSQALARRLYRTFASDETETVCSDALRNAFSDDEEAEAAFAMFDKDMNGDISMEELEAVCVEIGRERKAITASLKDLDSVISKLDDVFMFIVLVIAILVFISLLSTSAAGVLTSAGSTVLALSWLFSATAQEFLQSIIFVFVKHPFDVGDRVGIYGNTGDSGKGDDYFVKEIALLYTEFRKMQGHVVQAPNSYLNTLFILNQRRSGGLAEAVPVTIKFGTTLDQIEQLRLRLLEFVTAEKREYQSNILTELREVSEAHAITLNVVFFYKSNWQNELLRLQRRNKFICALMVTMQELGIEGPRMRYPGQKESFPVYLQNVPHVATPEMGHGGHPDNPAGNRTQTEDVPIASRLPEDGETTGARNQSVPVRSTTRARGESLAAMGRRLDFSLGMKDVSAGDMTGDIWEERSRPRIPTTSSSGSQPRFSQDARSSHETARSTAVESSMTQRLRRQPTDSSAVRTRSTSHRNRFFGRARNDDVESGMADIPEGSSAATPLQKLDPRTGLVSPAAVRLSDDDLPLASGAIPIHVQAASPTPGNADKRRV